MRVRFFAALLVAALNLALVTGCAAVSATPAPPALTAIEESTIPLAPVPKPAVPAPTEAPVVPVPSVAPTAPVSAEAQRITKEEATAIALADAGFSADQVTRLRVDFDYDDGRPEYEVDFHQGRYEYDYEIHAETGAILSRDKDLED